jgi:hypothetical protein
MADKTALSMVGWIFAGVTTVVLLVATVSVVDRIGVPAAPAVAAAAVPVVTGALAHAE